MHMLARGNGFRSFYSDRIRLFSIGLQFKASKRETEEIVANNNNLTKLKMQTGYVIINFANCSNFSNCFNK